ncbi:uncharacterized protein LOC131670105 isoform X2 [Phymastichus coffea]|nr:uncharacterized protein LOC131670105 isoform X2 [Phymastichus coffea]
MSGQATKLDWLRPPGPLNIWKVIDGYEMLYDGTCSPIKISLQEIPPDRHDEVIEHMCTYFMNEDPACKSLKTKDDPQRKSDMIALWRHCLNQGLVVGAFTIDYFGRLSRLAAVNMLLVLTDYSELNLVDIVQKFSSPLAIRLFKMYYEISLKADVCKIYGVDKFIYSVGLSVAPPYRGQKLSQRLLEVRTDIGRYYGIKATASTFTTSVSQALAEQAGFKVAHIQYYANLVHKDGSPVYPNIETPDMRLMIKKLE